MTKIEDLITYNPDTGLFKWLEYTSSRAKKGWFESTKICRKGSYVKSEYLGVDGKKYSPPRLAWYLMKGSWPKIIDHINRNATDNRWCNLRELQSNSENNQNITAKGYHKVGSKYRVLVDVNRKPLHIGYFSTEEEALKAYLEAKAKYHPFYSGTQ